MYIDGVTYAGVYNRDVVSRMVSTLAISLKSMTNLLPDKKKI